ncbi:heavy metal-associated isoprenylated plant protein 3-like isoform X1 [Salvia divinorum]|uniref:Heavy metal-associated isoprenylated plant protein 3-like isoform X1 n=1 Tax=Salvia divinorum TaxID=28513 RepID=A0ABD1GFK1_SALDI
MTKNKKSNGEEQSKKKESAGNVSVVLKANLHCEGCVSKVLKCIRTFDGVDTANIGDGQITVVGKIDPAKLRERVEKKTHKKVEVVSPQTKNGENAEKKKEPPQEKNTASKPDVKKSEYKEPPVTTAQLKVHLHCEGCIQKICRIIVKTKGYRDMKIDKQKEVVTVTGALDMKALAEVLKKHLKREVQIVPAKEAEKKENPGGEKGKVGGQKGNNGVKAEKMEWNDKMQFQVGYPYPYPYPMVHEDPFYNPYATTHAPQLFSDENPNACSLM